MTKYIKTEEGYKELEQIGAATAESVAHAQTTAEAAQTTAEAAQTTANNALVETNKVLTATSKKMDANNPTGTGSISINRKDDTLIGQNSTAIGTNTVAKAANQLTTGQYNIYSPISYIPTNLLNYAKRVTVRVNSGYRIIYSKKCYINDDYNGVLVECGNLYGPSNNMRDFAEAVVNLYNEIGAFWFVYGNYNPSSSFIEKRHVIYYYDNINSPIYTTDQYMDWDSYSLSDFNFEVVTHDLNNYAYIVGNGTSDAERSNAHTLDWDGNAWYAGDIYVGSTSGTNMDEGSKKLATEEYVNEKLEAVDSPKGVVLADFTAEEDITSLILPLSDNPMNYSRILIEFNMQQTAAGQVQVSLYSMEQNRGYDTIAHFNTLFSTTNIDTMWANVYLYKDTAFTLASKKTNYLWNSSTQWGFGYSLTNTPVDKIDAIQFGDLQAKAGTRIRVEAYK